MTLEQPLEELLRIEVRHEGGSGVIALVGELDLSNAARLLETIRLLSNAGASEITCDLGALTFVDSSGISVFMTAAKQAIETGRTFALCSPPPNVERTLHIAGVLDYLGVERRTTDPNSA